MEKPPFNPYIAIVIGVLSVSTAAVFVKLADAAPASIIANYRLLFAVLLMTPYVLLKNRHEFAKITKRDWLLASISGLFLAFHFILWFESLNFTSVASSVVLVTLQPIFAFLGTYLFFKERFTVGAVLSMIIAITGSTVISWGDFQISGQAFYGDMLALLGAVMVTGYFLVGQNVRKRLSLMTYTFLVYGISSLTLILYNLLTQQPFVGYPPDHWGIFLALAIIPTFFGHTLFNWVLKWVSTSTISMSIVFEPVGASILAYFILNETISWSQWLGGTVVILGLSLFVFSTSHKSKVKITHKLDT
ncbi:EamA family transporter [Pontibacillus yanchengensis]|uniref:EamA family transporter n=2 Tax=Pontibacillus yanchengensis TaxID=462910 RepID=A0A6I5A6T7_9BACI|nr:EamA family transporter [Pontibacillus yanchengensis]MYL36125.1 EamA family transporter [Pontibacillus yanchengensis]MYL55215.1 EamA family transporter [Pontibacillus yanchengensis]